MVLKVYRRFPSTNPTVESQMFTQCNAPEFTQTRVTGGCFVINPTGVPGDTIDGCQLITPVAPTTWSTIKSLYR
jgi:hypothetical protein